MPAYQFNLGAWHWGAVAAQSNVLVSHFTNFIKAMFYTGNFKLMPFAVWSIGVYSIVDLFFLRPGKFWHSGKVAAIFAVFKIIGFGLQCFAEIEIYFGVHPGFTNWFFNSIDSLGGKSIMAFIMGNILVSICISIPAASLFLPFLIDYGLVDFVGVIVRPVMRKIFRLPGRAAVIMVSAFLGNFSVGHIAINDQYKTGQMNEREAVIIGTSLSTVSVGFLLVLANNTHLNNGLFNGVAESKWNVYFWTAFLITLLVAFIGIRIFPLSRIENSYYPHAVPRPEPIVKGVGFGKLVGSAWGEALQLADKQDNAGKRIAFIMHETIGVLGTVASGTAFFATAGVLLYTYTPIFDWFGYIFWPFMKVFGGMSASETLLCSKGAAISFLEVTLPALLVTTGGFSARACYMLAVIPVTSIVFLASFVPCLMATDVPVKFGHICLIWLERMIFSIIIVGIFGLILFKPDVIITLAG
jgi:nucleoside recognition membrane protein YjiH